MMRLNKDTGEITSFIGDSGKFYLSGLPYPSSVFFSIYDDKYKILNEIECLTVEGGTLNMFIPAEFTDILTIPKNEDSAEYYYSIKVVYFDSSNNRIESTCVLSNHKIDEPNIFTVYAKRTEGGTAIEEQEEETSDDE